jgi:hypothetical protein
VRTSHEHVARGTSHVRTSHEHVARGTSHVSTSHLARSTSHVIYPPSATCTRKPSHLIDPTIVVPSAAFA